MTTLPIVNICRVNPHQHDNHVVKGQQIAMDMSLRMTTFEMLSYITSKLDPNFPHSMIWIEDNQPTVTPYGLTVLCELSRLVNDRVKNDFSKTLKDQI